MVAEDVIITTIHRAHEGGLAYALLRWNLSDHPWYGEGMAWWLNSVCRLLFNVDPGLTNLGGFAIAVLLPLALYPRAAAGAARRALGLARRPLSRRRAEPR